MSDHRQSTQTLEAPHPLRVAWVSYFPIEWLPDLPPELQGLPLLHPATWQRVLWEEFARNPALELHIIIPRSQFRQSHTFTRGNTTFYCVKTPPGLRAASFYWLDTIIAARLLREIKPDLVHAWGTEFGGAAIAGRLPYPALVTMQGILTWCETQFPLNRNMKLSRSLEPGSLRKADVVTCESSFAMKYLGERYPHLKLMQAEHAPHPVFASAKREPQLSPRRIVAVGSFSYAKGGDLVIKALDLLTQHDLELLWIGGRNAQLETQLRAETSGDVWQRVHFKNDLSSHEVAAELELATLLVHATRADNSPNSVKEAVVAGVPVVATNTGGIPDYVVPGENGFLFENGSATDCLAKIRDALDHPLFSKGLVQEATHRRMQTYLSSTTMAEKFLSAYQVALAQDRRAHRENARR